MEVGEGGCKGFFVGCAVEALDRESCTLGLGDVLAMLLSQLRVEVVLAVGQVDEPRLDRLVRGRSPPEAGLKARRDRRRARDFGLNAHGRHAFRKRDAAEARDELTPYVVVVQGTDRAAR